jgi:hypothetical protein
MVPTVGPKSEAVFRLCNATADGFPTLQAPMMRVIIHGLASGFRRKIELQAAR